MIEIIREERLERKDKGVLPKDIKQIGTPDVGDRIYMEHQVYEFLHPYGSETEKMAYVLLGRFENYAGRQCVFAEAAIRLEEVVFENGLPCWNDQTWGYLYRQLKKEYDHMVIIGWALDIKGQLPNMTAQLEQMHQEHFGGAHQILFLMDSLEREETFYGNRGGRLSRREGFYIYYDRHACQPALQEIEEVAEMPPRQEMQELFAEEKRDGGVERRRESCAEEKQEVFTALREGNYRKQLKERQEAKAAPAYASSILMLVIVGALGVTAYANHQKMGKMEETIALMNQTQTAAATETTEQGEQEEAQSEQTSAQIGQELTHTVTVENVAGNIEKQDVAAEDKTSEEANAVVEETQSTESAAQTQNAAEEQTVQQQTVTAENPAMTEAQTYLAQGYYVVQKGDSLVGICKKIYQTTAMMDKLCEVNGIEDQDAIYAGQYLTLPN